jgi:hypothetical protein
MKRSSDLTATALVRTLNQYGAVTLYGTNGLVAARRAIEHALAQAGCAITFEPASAPDLVDYLTVGTVSGIEGAALGAGLGALLGLLVDRPAAGLALGAGIGLVAGANRGVERVQSGWRVRAVRELDGLPCITINALGPA